MTNASGSSRLWGLTKMIGGAALVWFAGRALRKPEEAVKDEGHSAAFGDRETDRENFDQTRSAGPDAMRDETRRPWEPIDQALDESFPASDPPGNY